MKLEDVKIEINSRIIQAFNSGFFSTTELIRIQDAVDDADSIEAVNNEMMSHHLRVVDSFKTKMVDDLADKMKSINPTVN